MKNGILLFKGILLFIVISLLSYAILDGAYKIFTGNFKIKPKEKVLGEQKVEPTPDLTPLASPTSILTSTLAPEQTFKPIPTSIPTTQQAFQPVPTSTSIPQQTFQSVPTSTPMPQQTFQPIPTTPPQRIPVYLLHDGKTYYCDPVGADAVKDVSEAIVKEQEEVSRCNNAIIAFAQECANRCETERQQGRSECLKIIIGFDSCIIAINDTAMQCLDSCKIQSINQLANCPSVGQSHYNNLNSLLNTYCNP